MNNFSLDVLYEDNHLLAVNKPAGFLSQPTEKEADSMETRVKGWIKQKYQKSGNVFVGVVHRLDRPASGILIFAKTSKALSRLNETIRNKEMQKIYFALVEGVLNKKCDLLMHYLKQGDHCSFISGIQDKEAKPARLHYEVLEQYKDKALLKIVLETGRYHQIRCQCAAIGHPILGDMRYGAKKDLHLPPASIALHHAKLTLSHPVTKVDLCIEAPLPHYFRG